MIKGWYKAEGPVHTHDCEMCTYIMSVCFQHDDGEYSTVDIYNQCGLGESYLFRFSSEGSDYSSEHELDQLLILVAKTFIE